jgi:hypothetical protein
MRAMRLIGCRGLALLCAAAGAVAAGFDARPVFDLEGSGHRDAVAAFAAGTRDVEIDPRAPDARLPAILPGPADTWAAGTRHALRFLLPSRPARPLTLDLSAAETHDVSPPLLSVSLGDRPIRDVQTRRGTGLPPPHANRGVRSHYRVRIPAPGAGTPEPAVLSVTSVAGSWIVWDRVRLVEDPTFALAHLGLAGRLPRSSAALLALGLGLVVLARGARWLPAAAGATLLLLLLAWNTLTPDGRPLTPVPRWLWVVGPPILLLVTGPAPRRVAGVATALVLDPRRDAGGPEPGRPVPARTALLAMLPLWLAVTFLLQGDLVWRFGSAIWGADLDGSFSVWDLAWTFHALTTNPARLFDANIYYPARDTLALSDHRAADQLFFAPAYALSGSPIVAFNSVMTAQFVLTAVAVSLLAHRLFGSWRAAMLAGAMVAFSPTRIPSQLPHPHLFSLFWTPLALLFYDRFLVSRRWRDLWSFTACLLGQVLASFFLGYALLIALAAWTVARAAWERPPRLAGSLLTAAAGAAVTAPVIWWFARPYLRVRAEYGALEVSDELFRLTSADGLASYVATSPASLLYGRLLSPPLTGFVWEKWLFPGFLCLGFAALALALSCARTAVRRGPVWTAWALVVVFGVLSLGPELRLGPWTVASPYVVLWHVLPGFTSMRVPARFGMLAAFGLALAAAGGFRWLEERLSGTRPTFRRALFAGVLGVVVLEAAFHPVHPGSLPTPAEIPEEYHWLARHGVGALLELPVGETGDGYRDLMQQASYMYFSVYHWRPLVNGYSGHFPRTAADMAERVTALPSPEAIAYLRATGVRQILIHPAAQLHPRAGAVLGEIPGATITAFPSGSLVVTLPDVPREDALAVRLIVPGRLRPGISRAFGVLFRNDGRAYWVNPEHRACRLTVSWRGPGGRLATESGRVLPPVALAPGEMQDRRVPLRIPDAEGSVALTSLVSCDGPAGARRQWTAEARVTLRKSGEEPPGPAEASLRGAYVAAEGCAGCPLLVRAHVENAGRGGSPPVAPLRLAVQWHAMDGTALDGRLSGIVDVDAGDEAVVSGTIQAPEAPGTYEIWLGVVRSPGQATAFPPGALRRLVAVRP